MIQFRLRARDTAFAPQPDRHVKAAIRRLKRDLTAQNAAAGDDDFFDFHIDPVLHDNFLLL